MTATGNPTRFADLLTTTPAAPAAPHWMEAPSFGPLLAALPNDGEPLFETLAPTTASDLSLNDDDESQSSSSESIQLSDLSLVAPVASVAPFGLMGLAQAFPMGGGAPTAELLSRSQMESKLHSLGFVQREAAKPGLHYTPEGGAIIVSKEAAFTVQQLDATCVRSLQTTNEQAWVEFQNAVAALQKSQEIAHLTAVVKATDALQSSALGACSHGASLQRRLDLLRSSCQAWALARGKVARLLHQKKVKENRIAAFRKHISELSDALRKDREAVSAAAVVERKVAQLKRPLVMGLLAETLQEVTRRASLRAALSHPQ